jgi:hypothetical protein
MKSPKGLIYLVFTILFFIIIFFVYNPRLIYQELQPFFAFDAAFYDYHFSFRFGYLSIISQFFLQFLYYPILGSTILTLLLLTLAFIYRNIFRQTIKSGFDGIEFILPLFILWQLKSYTTGLETLIALIIAGIVSAGVNMLKQNNYISTLYQLITIYLVFTIFGLPVSIILTIIYFFKEWNTFSKLTSLLLSMSGLVLLVILNLFRGIKLSEVQLTQLSFTDMSKPFPGFWIACIFIAVAFIPGGLPFKYSSVQGKFKSRYILYLLSFPAFLILIISASFKPLFINSEKYKTEIDFYVNNKEWGKALQLKGKIGSQDRYARFQMNRALYGSGQMSENLFSVQQEYGEYSLFLTKEYSMACMPYSSDLYYDLGYIKASKYSMIEYQTSSPYSPKSLERIAHTSVLLGEFPIAQKYYTLLSKSLIYRNSSLLKLNKLKTEPNELMQDLRTSNLAIFQEDLIINFDEPDADLYNILRVNSNNKMAFEYLMSYFLLRNDLASFYHYLPLVKSSGYYSKMPKSYEEALLLYYLDIKKPADKWEFPISKSTFKRYKDFKKVFDENGSDTKRIKAILSPDFKDTFWYYRYFDNPGLAEGKLKFQKK